MAQPRADVADVLAQQIPRQRTLQGDELRGRALVREEEQAGVESSEIGVAVDVVVAAAKDADALVEVGMGEAHVAARVDRGLARGADGGEVRRRLLLPARERRAVRLVTARDALLLAQTHAIPRLDEHRDLARHEIGAADEPGRFVAVADPDVLIQRRLVVGEDVGRAVLEPEEVAGVA
jgi:hypothetical protein